MSMDITNPYTPVHTFDERSNVKRPLAGFTKVACIFFIILGALGLFGGLASIVQFGIAIAAAAEDPDQAKLLNAAFPGSFIVTVAFAVINGLVSIAELIAGIFGLQQKMVGAKMIRMISGFMLLFKFVETSFGVAQGYLSFPLVKEKIAKDMAANPNQPQVDVMMFMDIGMYIGLAFVVLMGLGMFLFYLFTFLNFGKQKTLEQFS